MKLSYDTGIVLHEIIANGFEHERRPAMIELPRNRPSFPWEPPVSPAQLSPAGPRARLLVPDFPVCDPDARKDCHDDAHRIR